MVDIDRVSGEGFSGDEKMGLYPPRTGDGGGEGEGNVEREGN